MKDKISDYTGEEVLDALVDEQCLKQYRDGLGGIDTCYLRKSHDGKHRNGPIEKLHLFYREWD